MSSRLLLGSWRACRLLWIGCSHRWWKINARSWRSGGGIICNRYSFGSMKYKISISLELWGSLCKYSRKSKIAKPFCNYSILWQRNYSIRDSAIPANLNIHKTHNRGYQPTSNPNRLSSSLTNNLLKEKYGNPMTKATLPSTTRTLTTSNLQSSNFIISRMTAHLKRTSPTVITHNFSNIILMLVMSNLRIFLENKTVRNCNANTFQLKIFRLWIFR